MSMTGSAGGRPVSLIKKAYASRLDGEDPLAGLRHRFQSPQSSTGKDPVYFAGNSLGLQPVAARELVDAEMKAWAERAVGGHFAEEAGWYSYHRLVRDPLARLVGATPDEVVAMNSLTANLHLMMVSFFRPSGERRRILIEEDAFPSDTYAVQTQLRFHGLDPMQDCLLVRPREGERTIRTEDIEEIIEREGSTIALVLLPGVHFLTGQRFDIARITACAHRAGCMVGFDLAHAAGNVPLSLHDWDVDFAVWCSYKYLNSGPGAIGGCFVHERHARNTDLLRFGGWWGNDPETRFKMHLGPEFCPVPSADGWQLSNPPILSLAPLRASLALFDEVGMQALRAKSVGLSAYVVSLIDRVAGPRVRVITPRPRDTLRFFCQNFPRIFPFPQDFSQSETQQATVHSNFFH